MRYFWLILSMAGSVMACKDSVIPQHTKWYKTIDGRLINSDTIRSLPIPLPVPADTIIDKAFFLATFPQLEVDYQLRIYQNYGGGIMVFVLSKQNSEWRAFAAEVKTYINTKSDSVRLVPRNVLLTKPSEGWNIVADSISTLRLDQISGKVSIGDTGGPTDGSSLLLHIKTSTHEGSLDIYAPESFENDPQVAACLRLLKFLKQDISLPTPALKHQ